MHGSLPWYFILPPDRDLPSGGNRYNEQLLQALRRASQPVQVINFAAYREALTIDQPNRFFIDSLFVRDLAALPAFSNRKTHTVFILHHLESMDPPSYKSRQQCLSEEQRAFTGVDSFLVTSPFSEQYLRKQRIRQPIVVIKPGIDTPNTASSRIAISVQPPQPTATSALMVANLVERKGILPWLQAFAAVVRATDAFTMTVVGRTDLEPNYAAACQQLVLQHPLLRHRVHFTGTLPYGQVEEYYARAQLLVSAARMETFGMAIQEAKAYRVPLLVLAGGYTAHHITADHDGYVFDTLTEIADFFVDLVRNPARLAALQAKVDAQQPAAGYGWDEAAQQLIQQFS